RGEIEAAAAVLRDRHRLVAASVIAQHGDALAGAAQGVDRWPRARNGGVAEIEHAPGIEDDEIERRGDFLRSGDAARRHGRRQGRQAARRGEVFAPGARKIELGHAGACSRAPQPWPDEAARRETTTWTQPSP